LVCNVSSSLPLTSVEWEKNSNGTITTINTESNTEKYSGSSTNTPSLLPNSLSHPGPVHHRCGDTNSLFYIES
jgi:hypothetical protein